MEKILINETPKTPAVIFDATVGLIELKGRSIPEDPNKFYESLLKWISEYCNNPSLKTIVNLQLEYFNTMSSKRIFELLKYLELIDLKKNDVVINWIYDSDDNDILEAGETFESMIKIPFKKIAIAI